MTHSSRIGLLILSAVCTLLFQSVSTAAVQSTHRTSGLIVRCPEFLPHKPSRRGHDDPRLSSPAQLIGVCRYRATGARTQARRRELVGQRILRGSVMRRVIGQLNEAPLPDHSGLRVCPRDDGDRLLIFVKYKDRPTHWLEGHVGGCHVLRYIIPRGSVRLMPRRLAEVLVQLTS
jgi:hypothetical protein